MRSNAITMVTKAFNITGGAGAQTIETLADKLELIEAATRELTERIKSAADLLALAMNEQPTPLTPVYVEMLDTISTLAAQLAKCVTAQAALAGVQSNEVLTAELRGDTKQH